MFDSTYIGSEESRKKSIEGTTRSRAGAERPISPVRQRSVRSISKFVAKRLSCSWSSEFSAIVFLPEESVSFIMSLSHHRDSDRLPKLCYFESRGEVIRLFRSMGNQSTSIRWRECESLDSKSAIGDSVPSIRTVTSRTTDLDLTSELFPSSIPRLSVEDLDKTQNIRFMIGANSNS